MHAHTTAKTHARQPDLPFFARRNRGHARHRVHRHSLRRPDFSERMRKIVVWLQEHGPATDRQVCEGLGFKDMNAVRPRVTELIDSFYLRESGETTDHLTGRTVRIVAIA